MIARGFKPVGWVAAVATAALGCYMLSLNVAAERAELAGIEREIIFAKRDIRGLQTELGTRGRLQQLQHWNTEVLALSAPASGQFLQNEFTLARYSQPEKTFEERATVRMASAQPLDVQPAKPAVQRDFDAQPSGADRPLVRQASLVVGEPMQFRPANSPAKPAPSASRPDVVKVAAAKLKPALAASKAKAVATKPVALQVAVAQPKPKAKAKPAPTKPPVKTAGLIDGSLAREIAAASRAETGSAGGR